ncbi:hypothetical protein Pla86_50640 [Planctomycetes bacterium Pla86]|uniref:Uncharacterized protein n=1 Tax=Engelhardtia mirabilis TaxID=2528011 RepID=A0A518BSJ9_9BACT|nr:hypothetical protein Pla133_50670 [Planctomycetes bacterium Pla133]QDV04269.1 hypothetical protein Pla86_50640 [Planctomycetes bacterium Pla86]
MDAAELQLNGLAGPTPAKQETWTVVGFPFAVRPLGPAAIG